MDQKKLEERLQFLEAQRDQFIAKLNQIEGMILESKFWLSEVVKPSEEKQN